jgi:hypothetical protein
MFRKDGQLSNAKFESYKLTSSSSDSILVLPIPSPVNLGSVNETIGWKDARNRATWNYLAPHHSRNEVVWIDEDLNLVKCNLDGEVIVIRLETSKMSLISLF